VTCRPAARPRGSRRLRLMPARVPLRRQTLSAADSRGGPLPPL